MKTDWKLLGKLFASTFTISAFTFGGGFTIVTLMKRRFVDEYKWIDEAEMLDITAMAQSSPGPIAVNAAILVGWRVAGFIGMITATLGTVIPPVLILSVISLFYTAFSTNRYVAMVLKGMQAGVAAVILDVVCGLGIKVLKNKSWIHDTLMAAAFIATFFLKINVIYIILFAAVVGIVLAILERRRQKHDLS